MKNIFKRKRLNQLKILKNIALVNLLHLKRNELGLTATHKKFVDVKSKTIGKGLQDYEALEFWRFTSFPLSVSHQVSWLYRTKTRS